MLARVGAASAVALVLAVAPVSSAHIDLLSPEPRAGGRGNADLDQPPCGQADPGRIPEKVSVFRPGETITVSWDAYVQHPSYFRLSFDADGDDSFSERMALPADPARDDPSRLTPAAGEHILDYVRDPNGELDHVEHMLTLPREPCDSCTLQLTQFIYDVPLQEATYYQCVDVTLAGEPVPPPPDEAMPAAGEVAEGCALRSRRSQRWALPALAAVAAALHSRRRSGSGSARLSRPCRTPRG